MSKEAQQRERMPIKCHRNLQSVYTEHPTSECPTLLELQAMYRGGGVSKEQPYPSRRPWRAQNTNTFYDPNTQ